MSVDQQPHDGSSAGHDQARPLVSMLLIAYRQEASVGEAVAAALAQTYRPLEIIVSDDASSDGTFAAIGRALEGYAGPHAVIANRNASNLGIGAHLSTLVERSSGELIVIAAGDDVSLPERCSKTVAAWLASNRTLDLIAAPLIDIDAEGCEHGVLRPDDLSTYRSAGDWLRRRPYVIGAAQAWTRRLFDRFGPIPAGTMGEDLIMTFRAIVSGGATTLAEPLVRYRRGGLSRRRRTLDAAAVASRIRANNAHAIVEVSQLLDDARLAGVDAAVRPALEKELARERFIRDVFAASTRSAKMRAAAMARGVDASLRLRMLAYAAFPAALAPFFAVKRALARER